jgi:class 3 adenylate cyclase
MTDAREIRVERLTLALASVAGASAACASRGDVATVAVLRDYYALLARAVAPAGGRVARRRSLTAP